MVSDMSKERKKPPPARVWTRGRWWWWVTRDVSKERKKPPPARIWMRGRRWWWVTCRKNKKNHLRLAFGRKGGGGGGSLGITGVSGGRRKNEWEKTGNDICRCPFSQRTAWASHFLGPPSRFSTPQLPRWLTMSRPHPSEEGRGGCGWIRPADGAAS